MIALSSMVKNAKEWAIARGLHRKNAVHGADEYQVPTREAFKHTDTERMVQSTSASSQIQNGAGILLSDPPSAGSLSGTHGGIILTTFNS